MANTFSKLASVTLGSGQNTIGFTSIPSGYTDLYIMGSLKSNSGSRYDSMTMTCNGITSTSYAYGVADATEGALSGDGSTGYSSISCRQALSGFGISGNAFSLVDFYIGGYTDTNFSTPIFWRTTYNNINPDTAQNGNVTWGGGTFIPTTAITSITFTCNGGNFITNSDLTLYGIYKLP